MHEDRESRLIAQIYDAAFDPDLWEQVMENITKALSGHTACMTILDVHTGQGTGCTALAPSETMDEYFAHWTQNNPLHKIDDPLEYLENWQPSAIRYEEWVERPALHKSSFFNDFLRPLGAENGIMIGVALIGTRTVTMNIARPLQRDVFSDAELAVARRWQSHLSRAARLGQTVQLSQAALDAVDHLVSVTPHRLFFIDREGRVRRLSLPAESMLAAGPELYLNQGVLSVCLPNEESEFRLLVARAIDEAGTPSAGGSMRLSRPNGRSYEIQVTPLGPGSSSSWSSEPIILVTVTDISEAAIPIELKLRSLFRFTPAEARVALALMRGGTLRETADAAGVSVNTVRAQLTGIFQKTGYRRQVELVRALLMVEQNAAPLEAGQTLALP